MRHAIWIGAVLCANASAAVFQCTNDQGETSFQDRPCRGSGSELSVPELPVTSSGLRESERQWLKSREARERPRKKAPRRAGDSQAQERRCWKKRQQLDAVRAKLRRGYKPAQGDRLRRQRRQYQDYLFQFCD